MSEKPTTTTTIEAYKGFDADWSCRGFKFEVGQTYKVDGCIIVCEHGFHACEHPFDVWNYYPGAGITKPAAIVSLSGAVDRASDDTKIAAAEITIKAELRCPDFIKRGVEWILRATKGNTATGYRGHAAATGDSGHAAATGDSGHAAVTGKWGHAAATGDRGHAAATGDSGHAAATGDSGHAAATGDSGHAAATGKWGIAASLGPNCTATAGETGWLVLAAWHWTGSEYELLCVKSGKVGKQVKAGVTYRLTEDGEFEEVSP